MHLATTLLSLLSLLLLPLPSNAKWEWPGVWRFCPWCFWIIPQDEIGDYVYQSETFCHAFVHQPIDDKAGEKPTHVAILNHNLTEMLSFARMGYDMTVALDTRPTWCAPGVATFSMGTREQQSSKAGEWKGIEKYPLRP